LKSGLGAGGRIAEALPVGRATVERIRKRYAEQGLAAALHDKKRNRIYERKMDGEMEAHLIALVNSPPSSGHRRWTLRAGRPVGAVRRGSF